MTIEIKIDYENKEEIKLSDDFSVKVKLPTLVQPRTGSAFGTILRVRLINRTLVM